MLRNLYSSAFLVTLVLLLASCEKKESALVLPPPGTASHATVAMGENYDKQIFFDLESGQQVFVSDPKSWNLAFESGTTGKHIFINDGENEFVFNTHDTDMGAITKLPSSLLSSGVGWGFDASCGLPDSTAIGEWYHEDGSSKKEVFLMQLSDGNLVKMRILSSSSKCFTLEWAPLQEQDNFTQAIINKDDRYGLNYFSFAKGEVQPDPPADTWDIVFTRYRYIYRNYPTEGLNFPYSVSGVLLNPEQTRASADSTTPFASINLAHAQSLATTNNRDIIGYDWKGYGLFTTSVYTVNPSKNYIIHTRKGQIYKLHFLSFYNSAGVKGYPMFEFERLL
ncbi:MAG: HmuY family protein [Bacteroidetes bacterium]|nr:HmuY family protein [Bacteroidota bacterium]